jgi:hypothetical protein
MPNFFPDAWEPSRLSPQAIFPLKVTVAVFSERAGLGFVQLADSRACREGERAKRVASKVEDPVLPAGMFGRRAARRGGLR